jgi:type 2 lantibiotic biosynthesis protein LanM
LLEWLCSQADVPDLRRLTVVAADDHGWIEYVEPVPCPNEDVHALHRRHGATLALLYALSAADCHFENIIAAGAYPVVVDLETLFYAFPPADPKQLGAAEQAVLDSTLGSVLGVGLLPTRRWSNASTRSIDVSGFGARGDEWVRAKGPQWEYALTDEMRQVVRERSSTVLADAVNEQREQDALFNFVDDIAGGFAVAYRALLENRRELLRADGLLAAFDRVETRSIVRPTAHYLFTLLSASHPAFLGEGVNLDRRFDRLIAADDGRPPDSPITAGERADLWQMDVPIFRTQPGCRDIWRSDGLCIPRFLAESGLERARRRISTMSESDLERQQWLIRLSIGTWALNRATSARTARKRRSPFGRTHSPTSSPAA